MGKLARWERDALDSHLAQLDQLAQTHRQFAETIGTRSDCAMTKSAAEDSAGRVERLTKLIRRLAREVEAS